MDGEGGAPLKSVSEYNSELVEQYARVCKVLNICLILTDKKNYNKGEKKEMKCQIGVYMVLVCIYDGPKLNST